MGRQLLCKHQDMVGMGQCWLAELVIITIPTAKVLRFAFKAPVSLE